jgi:CheY-like chemotaxis protein
MARVVVLISDLLFASRVQAGLVAAGYEVELVGDSQKLQERLGECDALVVDLTDERLRGLELVEGLVTGSGKGGAPSVEDAMQTTRLRTLGFYSHVDVETRERAQRAGFDLVVPRSRMAREGGELVRRLVDET